MMLKNKPELICRDFLFWKKIVKLYKKAFDVFDLAAGAFGTPTACFVRVTITTRRETT
jgi:hypothetical protein